jgi:hypothetical protein
VIMGESGREVFWELKMDGWAWMWLMVAKRSDGRISVCPVNASAVA